MRMFILKHLIIFRVVAAVIAFGIIAWLLVFTNALVGNPVSYFIVKNNAEKYVAENYADMGYVLERVEYNFKFGNYNAHFVKPGSEDYHFVESYGFDGKKVLDNYKTDDQIKRNVQRRLETLYRELVNSVLESPAYPYSTDIAFGELIFENFDFEGPLDEEYDYALPLSILVPDGLYNITELGAKAGHLTIYVDADEATPEKAAEVLLEINSLMERGGATFYAIDLRLGSDEYLYINNFRRSDFHEDGLVEHVRTVGLTAEEYNAKLAEKKDY